MGIFMIKLLVVFAVVSSLTGEKIVHRAKRFIEYGPDIAGPFCATRRGGCCPGRIDDCSVPILDTLCYCDRFCNRTRSDCCPDYFSFCFGQERSTPPPLRGKFPFQKDCSHLSSYMYLHLFFFYPYSFYSTLFVAF